MASNDDLITGLMIRYARREKLTDEEMRILEEWWEQFPEHQRLAEQFGDEDWVRAELSKMRPAPMQEIWEKINRYLDEKEAKPTEAPGRKWTRSLAVAAMITICAVLLWVVARRAASKPRDSGSTVAAVHRPAPVAPEDGILILNGDGQATDATAIASTEGWTILVGRKHPPYYVRLADGSNVWLASGALFENTVAGVKTVENYRLEGTAFFDVTRIKSRPFVLSMADDQQIEVMGTSFHVEAKKGDRVSRVFLVNGALRVRNGGDSSVMHASQEAVLSPGKTDVHAMRDSAGAMAWVEQSLYFHFPHTEFTDAIAEVASWYGYAVSNPKGLRGTAVRDDLRKDPSPEGVVFRLGKIETSYLYVWVNNKTIYISDKRAAIDR